jgi:hypothetical protein
MIDSGSGFVASTQVLPDLLGDERHDRMEQPQDRVEAQQQHSPGAVAGRRVGEP